MFLTKISLLKRSSVFLFLFFQCPLYLFTVTTNIFWTINRKSPVHTWSSGNEWRHCWSLHKVIPSPPPPPHHLKKKKIQPMVSKFLLVLCRLIFLASNHSLFFVLFVCLFSPGEICFAQIRLSRLTRRSNNMKYLSADWSRKAWLRTYISSLQCYITVSTETQGLVRDGEPRTATSTFTQLLSSEYISISVDTKLLTPSPQCVQKQKCLFWFVLQSLGNFFIKKKEVFSGLTRKAATDDNYTRRRHGPSSVFKSSERSTNLD